MILGALFDALCNRPETQVVMDRELAQRNTGRHAR